MKRHPWIPTLAVLTAVLLVLGACAPSSSVMTNVVPTLYSVQLPQDGGDSVTLQGRYFGDGQSGEAEDSYVVIGARSDCSGGVQVDATSWTANRVSFENPGGVGSGFVCVVVAGSVSNGLPASLN
ncbi:MAG: IPT/TIG domain-containing protein [Trueperaceae bacterium]